MLVLEKHKQRSHAPRHGYVYVLNSGDRWFKIGKAKVWVLRVVKQLKVQLPFAVAVEYAFQTDDCTRDEATLHRHFKAKRLNGEWFTLDSNDLEHIKTFCKHSGFSVDEKGLFVPDPLAEVAE